MERFLIGDILVEIEYAGVPVISDGNLKRFSYGDSWEGDRVRLNCTLDSLSNYVTPNRDRENPAYGLYSYRNEPVLLYHWGKLFHGFAVWPKKFSVTFDSKMRIQTPLREEWFFSVCAFHRQLLLRDSCVLHASYVDIGGEAILFTGPSNIGKSTQAQLWVQHQNASVINGDRVLLRKRGKRWHAFGYPSCGTSGICENRVLPLRAIVILAQDSENRIESSISTVQKIRSLTAATELYPWDTDEFDMALQIATDIVTSVPVVKLYCRPDEGAVCALKDYLEEGTT